MIRHPVPRPRIPNGNLYAIHDDAVSMSVRAFRADTETIGSDLTPLDGCAPHLHWLLGVRHVLGFWYSSGTPMPNALCSAYTS